MNQVLIGKFITSERKKGYTQRQLAGAFECPHCNNRFVPTTKEYVFSVHTISKRKLKCPKCGEYSYCRKVLTK